MSKKYLCDMCIDEGASYHYKTMLAESQNDIPEGSYCTFLDADGEEEYLFPFDEEKAKKLTILVRKVSNAWKCDYPIITLSQIFLIPQNAKYYMMWDETKVGEMRKGRKRQPYFFENESDFVKTISKAEQYSYSAGKIDDLIEIENFVINYSPNIKKR